MRGAIFDVDGTMLCSMNAWASVTARFCAENKIELLNGDAEAFKNMTLDESLPLIRTRYGLKQSVEEISDRFRELIYAEYAERVAAKEGLCEFLERLHDNGVKIAIATSGYDGCCQSAFDRLGILKYIDAEAFSAEVGVNKSEPDIYLLAAKRLDCKPQECVVFEDLLLGITGAKKGGFLTCAVEDESNTNERTELRNTADFYAERYTEELYNKIFGNQFMLT